jgi:hypothetical protein
MINKSTITNPSRRAICARAELIAQERGLSDGEIATVHKSWKATLEFCGRHGGEHRLAGVW